MIDVRNRVVKQRLLRELEAVQARIAAREALEAAHPGFAAVEVCGAPTLVPRCIHKQRQVRLDADVPEPRTRGGGR